MARVLGGVAALVALLLALSPCMSCYVDSYRAIVLDVQGDRMLLAYAGNRPMRWVSATEATSGQIVMKELGEPYARIEKPDPALDRELLRLYERYTAAYEGVIVEITEPPMPGRP